MKYAFGLILTLHLLVYLLYTWRQCDRKVGDFVGFTCVLFSVVVIGGFMWRGMLLP